MCATCSQQLSLPVPGCCCTADFQKVHEMRLRKENFAPLSMLYIIYILCLLRRVKSIIPLLSYTKLFLLILKQFLFFFNAVPEPIKTSLSQPQPAGTGTSTSTSTITNSSNGKRASANGQQPAASRYLPREVPPRFRQQEQKQLLKRGQPLPPGTLTGTSPAQGTGQAGASPPPQQGAGGQHHPSKTQAGKS